MAPEVTAIVTAMDDLGQPILTCTLHTVLSQSVPCTTFQGLVPQLLVAAGLDHMYEFVSCSLSSTVVLPAGQGYHYTASVVVGLPVL